MNSGLGVVVNKEIIDFDDWCRASWGMTVRDHGILLNGSTPQIRDYIDFNKASCFLKTHIAEKLILESCSHIGSFIESGDVTWYIHEFGLELEDDGVVFTGRRIQPLKAALLILANLKFSSAFPIGCSDYDHIRTGGAALSAMYLLACLEFLFRKKGRYLNEDGTIRRRIPHKLQKTVKNKRRVNNIEQAFILYLYRNKSVPAKSLRELEKKLGIGNRLSKVRHPVMHGEWPDPAFEAMFFGLIIAIFYYGQKL